MHGVGPWSLYGAARQSGRLVQAMPVPAIVNVKSGLKRSLEKMETIGAARPQERGVKADGEGARGARAMLAAGEFTTTKSDAAAPLMDTRTPEGRGCRCRCWR